MAGFGDRLDRGAAPPDPGEARSLDDLIAGLRLLKIWGGDPSYKTIGDRVNAAWTAAGRPPGELARKTTVVDCFRPGRRRVNADLVVEVVRALHPDAGYVAQWRQALRVISAETGAATLVRALDALPEDLAEFTGRAAELDRFAALDLDGGAVGIAVVEGMAGVGKTGLAIHAGHVLARDRPWDRVLFVDLRGFHPDPAQPPADPAAVLDGFLRLLGVPGQRIPHDLDERAALYRERLAGSRALVVLDNAADTDQVGPLLPDGPGCLVLVTSRRGLDVPGAVRVPVDVFTSDEAVDLLRRAVPDIPTGEDPSAPVRVALRCGYLPLALGLIAAHMRAKPGWTVGDHADRLDELHDLRRLDSGVELALGLSYRRLPEGRRRVVRLLALHPGADFDVHAAAALAGTDLDTAAEDLLRLREDHLLRQGGSGRYSFHDLVRDYAATRAADEERPVDRRAALARLFEHHLCTASRAMDVLLPAERHRRPTVAPSGLPPVPIPDVDAARTWLDTERANLVATAVHAPAEHVAGLAAVLFRFLDQGGHYRDGLVLHGHALEAARRSGDLAAEALAATNLGIVHWQLGDLPRAMDLARRAMVLARDLGDRRGEARTLDILGAVAESLGRYEESVGHTARALELAREAGDRSGEAYLLISLGNCHRRLGRYGEAVDHLERAIALSRELGDHFGESDALDHLGLVHQRLGRHQEAVDCHRAALDRFRELGYRVGEAHALNNLGSSYRLLGRTVEAAEHHRLALDRFRELGIADGEADALNGLGETSLADGHPDRAHARHTAALGLAGDRFGLARTRTGLGDACLALGEEEHAREHWELARSLYAELGVPEADDLDARLASLGASPGSRRG
ncbi:tetratricopeptide repeat protein [Umezawaea sp. Da 62-37]|uniref:ATP-binding protein n=1 Tax=Umezawaea sp. Da 62-37 TaxID=3075927 RepID=UPI0028F6FA32|nr:tetratricopeptide repeat protein [Umezawaea sp. Da 62-37]WNV84516.1 tetratricopeptide repeat protein [Umezawaea sp. Da 62-37]